jgi:hypothetical protein
MSLALFVEYGQGRGHFDADVYPNYLMVPERDHARVFLTVYDDWVLKSDNENIASVEYKFQGADGAIYQVEGKSVSSTFVHVYDHGKRTRWRLQVDVKPERPLAIAFHSVVQDSNGDKTTRDPGMPFVLVSLLNDVFKEQCNMPVSSTVVEDIKLQTTLFDIAQEQDRGPGNRRNPWPEWSKVADACDPTAEINVFFMPNKPAGTASGVDPKVITKDNICVFPDSMSDDKVKVALPHWVANFLGCSPTYSKWATHYLMFHTRADGDGDLNPNGKVPFIGKDCVRAINPYGNHR